MNKKFLLILFFSISLILSAQQTSIVKIGNDVITSREFKVRFETMPHITDDNFNLDSVKIKILNTLVAEKLWAKYAVELGIDTTKYFKLLFDPIERLFIRDALYKSVIATKTELTGEDIKFITQFSNSKAITDIYAFDDSISAFKAYEELTKNYSIPNHIKVFADTAKEITIGFMEDEELEKQILSAKSLTIFKPLQTNAGWFIIHKRKNERIAETTDKQNISTLKQKVIERRAKKIGTEYLSKLLSDIKLSINEVPFNHLVSAITDQYNNKISVDTLLKAKGVLIDEIDINIIKNRINDKLNLKFVNINNLQYTTNQFLAFLMYEDFKLKNPTKEGISKKLIDYIKFFAEQELITEEGIKQNLHKSPAVQEDLKVWRENILAQLVENSFVDTISVNEDEILTEYNRRYLEKKVKEEIRVQEVLLDNLDQVENVLNQIDKGTNFGTIAERFTIRQNVKLKQGVLGYITEGMFGEIGKIATKLKIGDVYGPIKTTDGYSIIKILDKRIDSTKANFENVRDILKQGLFSEKSYKLLNSKTADLAKKYGIEIDFTSLQSLKLSNINMFTHRFMGFGGKIAATPFTNSLYEWYEIYKKMKKESL